MVRASLCGGIKRTRQTMHWKQVTMQRRQFQSLLNQAVTKRHIERKILKTNARHLYDTIQNVDAYSEFLPLCTSSKIFRRAGNVFDASLTVGLPPLFTEDFVSRVTIDSQDLVVETKSLKSKLFDKLESRWKLTPTTKCDETHVEFWMEMTVSDPVIVATLDMVLEEVAGRQVEAFEKRCQEIPYYEDDETDQNIDLR